MADSQLPHQLSLTERSCLTMTGVTEVVSFDETMVVLHTSQGVLVVQGEQLRLKNLSPEGGKVEVDGQMLPFDLDFLKNHSDNRVCCFATYKYSNNWFLQHYFQYNILQP